MNEELALSELPQPLEEGTAPPDALDVDGDNPNEMTDEQFGLLCDRMRENGWLGGPIITDETGLIADGEHRWRAAQEIGLAEVPVRQYDIDDATRRLWRQELNKIHGEHDAKRDALEYDHLLSEGFTEEVDAITEAAGEDLDELLAQLRMDSSKPAQYDYDPEHNVYFEDCVEGMRERLDDDSVDMVFTSPPYNVDLRGERRSSAYGNTDTQQNERVYYEDDRDWQEYLDWMGEVLAEVARVLKPSGHLFWNVPVNTQDGTSTFPQWAVDRCPLPCKSIIVWNKPGYTPSAAGLEARGRFAHTWEPIIHFSEEPPALNGRNNTTVWDVHMDTHETDHNTGSHPAAFPVALVKEAIPAVTEPGDLILDPFLGSGTTAVAAIETDRDYVGFELDLDDAYRPIIERRIGEAKRQREASVNKEAPADD